MFISDECSCGEKDCKYFMGCKNNNEIFFLCIKIAKMSGYVESFDDLKYEYKACYLYII